VAQVASPLMAALARTFLFAYANDHAVGGRHPRNLAREGRWIRRALRPVVEDKLAESVPLANGTIDDILDECQHSRARLVLFRITSRRQVRQDISCGHAVLHGQIRRETGLSAWTSATSYRWRRGRSR
jgi:hypothetical protein